MDELFGSPYAFPGAPVTYQPDLPGLGGGMNGMALQMLLGPLLQQYLGPGYMPAPFSPRLNLYDQYQGRQFLLGQQRAMRSASEADQKAYYNMVRGLHASVTGKKPTERQEEFFRSMAADAATVMPFLSAQNPEFFDQLHGPQGSAAILAQQMHLGGRYAIDPVTGAYGYSPETSGAMSSRVFKQLYDDPRMAREMRGMGAGQAGVMFDELQRRGLMGSADRGQMLESVAAKRGVTVSDLRKTLDDPKVESELRQFDADRIAAQLQKWAGAVSSLKDLFAKEGIDAPIPALMRSLEQFIDMRGMTPQKVEQVVREAGVAAQTSGLGARGMFQVLGAGAQMARAAGLDSTAGFLAGTGAMEFATAFRGMRQNIPGLPSMAQATMLDTRLRVNAASSPFNNQLVSFLRVEDEFGGFKAGSEAAAVAQAARAGRSEYEFNGQRKSLAQSTGALQQILLAGANNREAATLAPAQTDFNRAWGTRNAPQLADLSRRLQPLVDTAPLIRIASSGALAGLPRDQASAIQEAMVDYLINTPGGVDVTAKGEVLGAVQKRLAAKGVNVDPAKLQAAVGLSLGQLEAMAVRRGFAEGGANRMLGMQNRPALKQVEGLKAVNRIEAEVQKEFSKFARSGPLARISGALQDMDDKTTLRDVVGRVLGWQPTEEVMNALKGPLESLQREMGEARRFSPANARDKVNALQEEAVKARAAGDVKKAEELERQIVQFGTKSFGRDFKDAGQVREFVNRGDDDVRQDFLRGYKGRLQKIIPQLEEAARKAGVDTDEKAAEKGRGRDKWEEPKPKPEVLPPAKKSDLPADKFDPGRDAPPGFKRVGDGSPKDPFRYERDPTAKPKPDALEAGPAPADAARGGQAPDGKKEQVVRLARDTVLKGKLDISTGALTLTPDVAGTGVA